MYNEIKNDEVSKSAETTIRTLLIQVSDTVDKMYGISTHYKECNNKLSGSAPQQETVGVKLEPTIDSTIAHLGQIAYRLDYLHKIQSEELYRLESVIG